MPPPSRPHFSSESGSVLMLIFVGVALFAALGFAVSAIMSSGDSGEIGEQQASLYANEILDQGRILAQGVQAMKINANCSKTDVSFINDYSEQEDDYEHSPPSNPMCQLFNAQGGDVKYLKPPERWLDKTITPTPDLQGYWLFPANVCIPGIGTAPLKEDGDCSSDDIDNESLIVFLPYVKEQICSLINRKLRGRETIPAEEGLAWPADDMKFSGTLNDDVRLDQERRPIGCFEGKREGDQKKRSFHFYQVIYPG